MCKLGVQLSVGAATTVGIPSLFTLQDVRSRSLLVRFYYSNRLFMGFCCVCCEVEYLCLYLLSWPRFQKLGLMALQPALLQQIPHALVAALPSLGTLQQLGGIPVVAVVALLALPGVMIKQTCNWLQLRVAAEGLVDYDLKRMALEDKEGDKGSRGAYAAKQK